MNKQKENIWMELERYIPKLHHQLLLDDGTRFIFIDKVKECDLQTYKPILKNWDVKRVMILSRK